MARGKRPLLENISLRLGRTVNEAVLTLPPDDLVAVDCAVRKAAEEQKLLYEDDDGKLQPIPVLLRPRILSRDQRRFFHEVCLDIVRALEKLYLLWSTVDEVRELLPLTEGERSWFDAMPKGAVKAPQSIFGRLDVQVDFADPDWEANCHFFEANTVGAGGIYYTPTADRIVLDTIVARMRERAPDFIVSPSDDPRTLLLHTLTDHADQIGLRRREVGLMQDRRCTGGPEEFPQIADYFREHGVNARVVDPRDLVLVRDQLTADGAPIDLLYRDTTIEELAEMEKEEGKELAGVRWAFRNNRVVSSIAGEFDHKSAFEVLSDPRFHKHFTARQRKRFEKYIPWTRTVREGRTTGLIGSEIDLVPFVRKNRGGLVLKPNRGFGGDSVVIGPYVELGEWDDAIDLALKNPGSMVVQRFVPSLVKDFPVVTADGRTQLEEFYVVCGFYVTPDGLGILGRASKKRVVNVAQKGGLVTCMVLG
ncbi:MAG: hypothetical protein AAB434_12030 [Planctomycetota bacterium]